MGNDALEPRQIKYFNGIDPSLVERPKATIDGADFIIRGGTAKSLRVKPERIILKGRLDTREFFEMAVRPGSRHTPEVSKEAEAFWKTPGQLEPDWLSGSPNPFRNATSIFYEIPNRIDQEDGTVLFTTGALDTSVKIYNVSGRLISVLVENRLAPGTYSVDWAAVDDHGNSVASGVYYLKLQIEKKFITKRLILLK